MAPGGGDDDSTPPKHRDPPTDNGLAVEDIVVRKAVTYESTMGSGGVLAGDERQYVVAAVRGHQGQDLSESAFTFETDAESWAPGLPDTAGAINRSVAGHGGGPVGRALGGESATSYLAFTVPSPLSASNPRIRFSGTDTQEWPLSSATRDRLAAPAARFELEALDVPADVSQGHQLSVTLTAKNTSKTDGRFLAAVYWPTKLIADDDESHIVEREVAAGDEVTASLEIDTQYTTARDEAVTLSVDGHVTGDREVQIRDASTPT